jgi:hypothetical protein
LVPVDEALPPAPPLAVLVLVLLPVVALLFPPATVLPPELLDVLPTDD